MDQPINVTSTYLPPLDEYVECVRDIFSSHTLTNNGKYLSILEKKLAEWLNVPFVALCANGTLALQLAIRLLGLNGKKVITTPFTYVATLTAQLWEGCDPVFADIDPETLCIDPQKVEDCLAAHPDATGIIAVHVYGNACDVQALGEISRRHCLKVLYDAAHAFGDRLYGRSLFTYGDAAIGSLHATKLFHAVEGGLIVTPTTQDIKKIALLRAFGHIQDDYQDVGINAKMSELHAAMGVCILRHINEIMQARARFCAIYDDCLRIKSNSYIRRPLMHPDLDWNHAYYPVVFASHELMLKVYETLKKHEIHPRRYFYPSLSRLPYVKSAPCPVAEDIAERVLCLPLWADMPDGLPEKISAIIMDCL